jgi:hypothetical protein
MQDGGSTTVEMMRVEEEQGRNMMRRGRETMRVSLGKLCSEQRKQVVVVIQ